MVQPYQPAVDTVGETAVLCIDGEPGHALRKRAVLRPDEVAPIARGRARCRRGRCTTRARRRPATATAAELELARGDPRRASPSGSTDLPLYARVDTVRGAAGEPVLLELEPIEPNFHLDPLPLRPPCRATRAPPRDRLAIAASTAAAIRSAGAG